MGTRVGDFVVDISVLVDAGFMPGLKDAATVFRKVDLSMYGHIDVFKICIHGRTV